MNNFNMLRGVSLLAAVAVVSTVAMLSYPSDSSGNNLSATSGLEQQAAEPSAVLAAMPADGVAAAPVQLQLVHAEQFRVTKPFEHLWRSDRPKVTSGWLLVLEGQAAQLALTQNIEPVLYVGAQTAERINAGTSGRVVVLVPGDFRLQEAPMFLGPKALPEALDQTRIDAALQQAVAAGVVAPTEAVIKQAYVAGIKPYATDFQLRLRAIDLVEQHSPEETDLIAGWRVPLVK